MELGLTRNEARAYVVLVELSIAVPLNIVETQQGKPKLYRVVELSS